MCFGLSIVTRREALAALLVSPEDAAANAAAIASHTKAIADAEARRQEAARSIETIDRSLARSAGG